MSTGGEFGTFQEMLDEHVRQETGRAMLDRKRLHEILDELLFLKEISDPWSCPDPDSIRVDLDQGKYAIALYAEILSACLIKAAAGWAFCHVIGAKALEATSSATKNSHACERTGALGISDDEPSTLRKALVAAVDGCEGVMPQWLRNEVVLSLKALDLGEVRPLMMPTKTKRRGRPFALLLVRFRAVLLANYWFGQGGTLKQAENRMAEALAVSREAIRRWTQTALPEAFGKKQVRKRIEEARAAGRLTAGQSIEDYLVKYAASEASVRDFAQRHERVNLRNLRRRHNDAQTAQGNA
jgi:hypothetical protein